MPSPTSRFPGFDSPAASFEQPFEMLEACHTRVQRSLDLLRRLVDYIDQHGHDASTRAAAADVLRYFDLAAPLHHEDEEKHVFPRLLASGDAALRQAVQALQREHEQMGATWAVVREPVRQWTDSDAAGGVSAAARADIARFLALYAGHIETEENRVYPAAQAAMDDDELAAMGQDMQKRRQQR